jgi:hypothetical protein
MINNFQLQIINSIEEIESIRQVWEEMQDKEEYPKINTDIDRYLSIINNKTSPDEMQPFIMLVKRNDSVVTMLIGCIHKSPLECKIGRKTIFKPSLRTLSVIYGGLLGNKSECICRFLIGKLTYLLRHQKIDVIHFNHFDTSSSIYKIARKIPGILSREYFPKIESHVAMPIPQDFNQFLQSCSRNRRKHIKKYIRRLKKEYPEKISLSIYTKPEKIELAIETASHISSQTYQRAFGSGLINDKKTRVLWNIAAKKGWLRVYILNINNKPCAFRYGLKYRGTYFGEQIGYLPEWKKYNVGTVLFAKFIEQICQESDVKRIDFGFGGGFHKELGNSFSWPEASIYIFAPRFFPALVNVVRSFTSVMSIFVYCLVVRLHILNLVQRFRRRRFLNRYSMTRVI